MSVRVGSRSGPWRHRLSAGRGRPLERLQLISHLVFTSTLTSVVEERVWKYQLEADWLDKWDVARSNQWNHLLFSSFFCLFLSAAVPRNSQLPPSVEHASVLAVWDWGVQSHLPLHLRPEELLHRWVNQHTVSRRRRCPFQAATLIISQARFTSPPPSRDLSDLIQDWASDSAPDIYSFVPYSWKFKILFHQFEMIWAANQHNWIDCSTKQQENGRKEALQPWSSLGGITQSG